MNQSNWNAWHIANFVRKKIPDGVNPNELHEIIEKTCGADRRTIAKYQNIILRNKYLVLENQTQRYKANPNLDYLKPKSPKQLLEEE